MSSGSIRNMATQDLVEKFVHVSVEQDQALLMDEKAFFRALYDQNERSCQNCKRAMEIRDVLF